MLLLYSQQKSSDVIENQGCGRRHWNKSTSVACHGSLQFLDIQDQTEPVAQRTLHTMLARNFYIPNSVNKEWLKKKVICETLRWWPEWDNSFTKAICLIVSLKTEHEDMSHWRICLMLCKFWFTFSLSPPVVFRFVLRLPLKGRGPIGQCHSQRSPGAGCAAACLAVMYTDLYEGSSW